MIALICTLNLSWSYYCFIFLLDISHMPFVQKEFLLFKLLVRSSPSTGQTAQRVKYYNLAPCQLMWSLNLGEMVVLSLCMSQFTTLDL